VTPVGGRWPGCRSIPGSGDYRRGLPNSDAHASALTSRPSFRRRDILRREASGFMAQSEGPDLGQRLDLLRQWRKQKKAPGGTDPWALRPWTGLRSSSCALWPGIPELAGKSQTRFSPVFSSAPFPTGSRRDARKEMGVSSSAREGACGFLPRAALQRALLSSRCMWMRGREPKAWCIWPSRLPRISSGGTEREHRESQASGMGQKGREDRRYHRGEAGGPAVIGQAFLHPTWRKWPPPLRSGPGGLRQGRLSEEAGSSRAG